MSSNVARRAVLKIVVSLGTLTGGWFVWNATMRETADCRDATAIVVSRQAMLRLYRDSPHLADQLYTGRRIHITMSSGEYRHAADLPPLIVSDPPCEPGTVSTSTIGICLGLYPCEEDRGDGCRFFIKLECCDHK